jgi:hypothetical protein
MGTIPDQQSGGKWMLTQIGLHHTFDLQSLQLWKNMVISLVSFYLKTFHKKPK